MAFDRVAKERGVSSRIIFPSKLPTWSITKGQISSDLLPGRGVGYPPLEDDSF
jgi:hypothetical protein